MFTAINKTNRQAGAALVVSMVLLLVLTLLAISTMRTASLEVSMAGNAQYQENAFQLAETGIDTFLAGVAADVDCISTDNPGICDMADEPLADMNGTFTVNTTHPGTTNGCLDGSSWDEFDSYQFQTQAVGATTTKDAASTHTQGWYVCRRKFK